MKCKRYFPPELLYERLASLEGKVDKKIIGRSVNGLPIYELKLGRGEITILIWSQMHGNESTTTKALLKLLTWLLDSKQKKYLNAFSFYMIPQLNPDGAKAYIRTNANQVDLNRDAIDLSQPESKVLKELFDSISPNYALNLHGQKTIYGVGSGSDEKPATLSFLAPAADQECSITPARVKAMSAIVAIKNSLEKILPKGIGRYNDQFNPNCFGDAFTKEGTPTILFEAGHYPNDYQREKVSVFVFKAFKALFKELVNQNEMYNIKSYFEIPENTTNYVDLIVSNVDVYEKGLKHINQLIAIQYVEVLKGKEVVFLPSLKAFGKDLPYKAHRYLDMKNMEYKDSLYYVENKIIDIPELTKLFSIKSNF